MNKPDNLCLAPWVHTYLSPVTERRLCCASREPAQSFTQYIDTDAGDNVYTPQSLDEYWNSERIRRVRRDMMNNIVPAECEVCDKKLLNTDVYRDYFGHLFAHKYPEVVASTDETGYTTMKPVSWDYRFSNLCNFKCRMCGPMLSSSWETEARKAGKIEPWMEPAVKKQISNYQDTQIEAEFSQAVEEHRIEEIYWVGGEPLMYEQHWRYMQRIIELGDGPGLYARYNTNLSRIDYQGVNLYNDILDKIRDWQICASLDGVGEVGEYIRTGLKYDEWLENFKQGLGHARNRRMMRIDFTLTTPGLFEVPEIIKLADELGVEVLAKTTFAFTPDIAMSPLFLPRPILEQIINSIMPATPGAMRDVLTNLINRPTFEEEYPSEVYLEARCRAKQRMESLDTGRKGTRFVDTLRDPELIKWWKDIPNAVD